MISDFIQVLTTTASAADASAIARALVEARLAACVQVVGPVQSTYRWKEAVENAEEWQCVIKTRRALWDEVERAIRRLHSYEVPEILALPVVAASGDYLAWLEKETRPPQPPSTAGPR